MAVQQKSVFTAETGEGEKIQTKQGLVEPHSPSISERLRGKLQASFSFYCIRVCLLVGADWQARLCRDLQCRCLLQKYAPRAGRWFSKGTEALKKKNAFDQKKDFEKFVTASLSPLADPWIEHCKEHNIPDLSLKYILYVFF
jgi:hypothetical protein